MMGRGLWALYRPLLLVLGFVVLWQLTVLVLQDDNFQGLPTDQASFSFYNQEVGVGKRKAFNWQAVSESQPRLSGNLLVLVRPSTHVVTNVERKEEVKGAFSHDMGYAPNNSMFTRLTHLEDNNINDTWKELATKTANRRFLVFSAYFDVRQGRNCVTVIAVGLTKKLGKLICRLFMDDGQEYNVDAISKPLPEHWNLMYAALIVSCPVPSHVAEVPLRVAILRKQMDRADSNMVILDVHHRAPNDSHLHHLTPSRKGEFAVCVKPIHYNFDRAVWLVEFMEFHRLLGVNHFYFYSHTVGENVQRVLDVYKQLGLVTLLPWALDMKSQKEIRTEGMFAALNDCLYRTMFLYDYVVMVDFDEFIIPRKHANYTELMNYLDNPSNAKKYGAFVFQNVFFYLYWANDTEFLHQETGVNVSSNDLHDVPYLITLFKTRRLTVPHKHGLRSKFIVKPVDAVEVGNHNVWKLQNKKRTMSVPNSVGLSHHYRICEFGGFQCLNKTSTIDRSTWTHAPQLLERVLKTCQVAFPGTQKCPDAPPLGSPW